MGRKFPLVSCKFSPSANSGMSLPWTHPSMQDLAQALSSHLFGHQNVSFPTSIADGGWLGWCENLKAFCLNKSRKLPIGVVILGYLKKSYLRYFLYCYHVVGVTRSFVPRFLRWCGSGDLAQSTGCHTCDLDCWPHILTILLERSTFSHHFSTMFGKPKAKPLASSQRWATSGG